jgi:serine/threonine protein phosphatase PrpC
VTRSFGDWIFENLVISMPAHHSTQLKPEDSFLILASDGLWDSLTYQEATDLVLEVTESVNNEVITAQKVSELLANAAIKKSHSDNVTVIVVKLK